MFLRSASGTSSVPEERPSASVILLTGTDSPVSADSSIFIDALSTMRQSAGTASPASSTTTSPGTSSSAGIMYNFPLRMTFDCAALIFCRAERAFSAWYSWATPRIEFSTTTNMMMITSAKSASPWAMPVRAEITAATISMITIGSAIIAKKRFQRGSFAASLSLLGPIFSSRAAALALSRPCSSELACSCTTSPACSRYSFIKFLLG